MRPGFLLSAAIVAGCSPRRPPPPAPPRPHVLLLTLDTLRRDAVGCYAGERPAATPHLDSLAQRGLTFDNAVVAIPTTLPSHAAIMSGRTPRHSGVRSASDRVPDDVLTLAEIFDAQGYATAAFLSATVLGEIHHLDQGFAHYDCELPAGASDRPAAVTVDRVLEWLTGRDPAAAPLFLWVHLFDPHSPYEAPAEFARQYVDPDYAGVVRGTTGELTRWNAEPELKARLTDEDLRHLRGLYLAEVGYMDHHVGRLLDEVGRTLERGRGCLIAALADHGESLGEHGEFFHGYDLYDPAMHIPMWLAWAGALPAGRRVARQVRAIDLAPTLLGLLGLPGAASMEGTDLSRALRAGEDPPELMALLETEHPLLHEADRLVGLRTDRWKYIDFALRRGAPIWFGKEIEIALDRPMFAGIFVQQGEYVSLVVNVRFGTREKRLLLPIRAVRFGTDPLHQAALDGGLVPRAGDPKWRWIATPDLHRRAYHFGRLMGWPVDAMTIEGVGVDLSPPLGVTELSVGIDDCLMIAPGEPPPGPPPGLGGRAGVWVIEDFETGRRTPFAGSANPRIDAAQVGWLRESALPAGQRAEGIVLRLLPDVEYLLANELYELPRDPPELRDLLVPAAGPDIRRMAADLHGLLGDWVRGTPQNPAVTPAELTAAQREALESLGYFNRN